MTTDATSNGTNGRRILPAWVWTAGAAAALLIAVLAWLIVGQQGRAAETRAAMPTFVAQRGPLTISVSESGTIKSREQVIIKSEVEGQTTIIYLIPEGRRVKAGDMLVELDASNLMDKQAEKQITVLNAESAFVRARENLEVVKNQAQADTAQAELDARFAKEDLDNYQKGEFPNAQTEAQAKITLAEEELQRAKEKAGWSRRLFAEKYISQTELQSDVLAENRARLDLELAKQGMDLLKDFTAKRRVDELASKQEQSTLALERVKRKASADVAQAESELKAKEFELGRQKDLLEKVNKQIERTKIYAPTEGLAVYATTSQGGPRGNNEPLQEGQTVRERQEIIYLPTTTSVTAEVAVHESNLDRVRVGLPALVTVDALPGRVFSGRVVTVAPLPDAQSVWMNPDLKVYKTQVELSGDMEGLRTGMSCRAEMIVEQHEDAVFVPVQAVLRVSGKPTVYVVDGDGGEPEARQIQLGMDNNSMAHIEGGLKEGERVLLTPPLSEAGNKRPDVPVAAGLPAGNVAAKDGAPAPGAGGPGGDQAGDRPRRGPGGARPEMTPEQREEMRKRFENMTPEEREKMRQNRQRGGGGGGGRNGGGGQRDAGGGGTDQEKKPSDSGTAPAEKPREEKPADGGQPPP